MIVVFEKLHAQETKLPKPQDVDKLDSRLPLVVVFTSGEATVQALKKVGIAAILLFANFAQAVAEASGKAQADTLPKAKSLNSG